MFHEHSLQASPASLKWDRPWLGRRRQGSSFLLKEGLRKGWLSSLTPKTIWAECGSTVSFFFLDCAVEILCACIDLNMINLESKTMNYFQETGEKYNKIKWEEKEIPKHPALMLLWSLVWLCSPFQLSAHCVMVTHDMTVCPSNSLLLHASFAGDADATSAWASLCPVWDLGDNNKDIQGPWNSWSIVVTEKDIPVQSSEGRLLSSMLSQLSLTWPCQRRQEQVLFYQPWIVCNLGSFCCRSRSFCSSTSFWAANHLVQGILYSLTHEYTVYFPIS